MKGVLFPELRGGYEIKCLCFLFFGTWRAGTKVIPGARAEDEARIEKSQVSRETEAVEPGVPQWSREQNHPGPWSTETSLALSSPDLPKDYASAYTQAEGATAEIH